MNSNTLQTDQEKSTWEDKINSLEKEEVRVPMEPLEQVELNYEDRCLIRMNALSKVMSFRENGKGAKEKINSLKLWQKIVVFIMVFVIVVIFIVNVVMFTKTTKRWNIIFLWVLISIITLCIYFTF